MLRTEPPVDQITQLNVAQVVTARVTTEGNVGETEVRERRCSFLNERDRPVPILFACREPHGDPSRADAAGEYAAMQHGRVREPGAIARDVRGAAAAAGEPRNEHMRVIDDKIGVRSDPVEAVHYVGEIRGHISLLVANFPRESSGGELP